jgi:adhesin transport system outer membrane protein
LRTEVQKTVNIPYSSVHRFADLAPANQAKSTRGLWWAVPFAVALLLSSVHDKAAAQDVPELIQAAVSHHPLLRTQQGRRDAAQAGIEAARWQFWPTPSISVESAASSGGNSTGRGGDLVGTLRVQQPLWTGGRLTGNLSRAEARALTAEAELQEAKQQLALRVSQSWSEVLVAQYKLRAYDNGLAMHQRLLSLVRRRVAEGVSAQADVALASSRLSTLQAEHDAVTAQQNTALERLRSLTGRPLNAQVLAQARRADLPAHAESLPALLESARALSPQLAKARSQAKVAQTEVALARAALSPEVYVRLERQFGNSSPGQQSQQSRIYVGLNSAFGGGLSSLSGIEAAVAQQRAAQEEEEVQLLALQEQLQADYTLATTAQIRRTGLESARQATADVSESYERQFLAGRKQWQDLMNAAREQTQSEVQLADAVGAQQLANWRLAIYSRGVDDVMNTPPPTATPTATGERS